MDQHKVLILGGGFGGLKAAQALKRAPADVTLIDKRNFHLFQPLLYQVATGSLSPGEIAAPLRSVLSEQKNTRVLLGEAVDIDPNAKEVLLRDGARLAYDSLIVATGSQSTYFGHDEWREWAPALKSVEDATAIRHKLLVAFEEAERSSDPEQRRAWLTFVIVGAGPTGVELAGALGEIAVHTLKHDFRSIHPADARILVLDTAPRVLATYPEDLSRKAERSLLKLRARVRTQVTVTCIDRDGVTIKTANGNEHIASHTVIWAAGVAISEFGKQLAKRTSAPTEKGRIKMNPDLTIPNFPDIFVVGDLAYATRPNGKPLPGVAQVAMQGGAYAAKVIASGLKGHRSVKPFHYFDKGDLAVIGRAAAIADIFGIHLSGLLAWLVWLFIHLLYIVEFQSRVLIFIEWGFLYLTYNRGARLITGDPARNSSGAREAANRTAAP
ncbi:MAG: NAD(P)/FAD-dependent oxidoreductase [Acidobacteriaceae bacterium]|nr:NAD(P)/FAD-dependent oxidoreductase [Acidobacteriaceae bacterium]